MDKQHTNVTTARANAVTTMWGSLRLAPISGTAKVPYNGRFSCLGQPLLHVARCYSR